MHGGRGGGRYKSAERKTVKEKKKQKTSRVASKSMSVGSSGDEKVLIGASR